MFLCCLPKSWRRRSNAPSPMILPNELHLEILSFLSVKTLTRLKSVSKSWNTLISDSTFVKMHLKRSPRRNPHLTVLMWRSTYSSDVVAALPVRRLLKNRSITAIMDKYTVCYRYNSSGNKVVGSCNGLVCILLYCINKTCTDKLCFWNPATKTRSEKTLEKVFYGDGFRFAFGYDSSTGTYKVVVFRVFRNVDNNHGQWTSDVRVFNLVDNSSWRNIHSFPAVPLNNLDRRNVELSNDGVYLSGTLNWLALRNIWSNSYVWNHDVSVEQFVIVSLDLSTEMYTELLLPRGFNELPWGFEDQFRPVQPTIIHVLLDCLCFCHDSKGTEFVIWQMKEFGVRESWTQLLKVCYQNLQMDYNAMEFQVLPLCLSENGDTVILKVTNQGYFYYWRVNRVEGARILNGCQQIFEGKDYIQSLVSPP